MKDKIVFLLSVGIIVLLGMLIIGDFIISLKENRPVDESIIHFDRVKNANMVKEWLGVDTVFKVHSKGVYYFCEEIKEPEWENID